MHVAHIQLQVCYTQWWAHTFSCVNSELWVGGTVWWADALFHPGRGRAGGLLNTSSELTGSAASGLRSARSAAETFLNIDRRSVCVTRPDLFILTQLWPLTWLAGETGRERVARVSRFSHSRTQNKSLVCSWQLIRNLGAQSAAESKQQFFDHLPAPANQKPAGMCAAHLELFSLFTCRHTQTHFSLLCSLKQAAASLQEDNKLNTTMIHHHHHITFDNMSEHRKQRHPHAGETGTGDVSCTNRYHSDWLLINKIKCCMTLTWQYSL